MIVLVYNFDFDLFVCVDKFGHKIIFWMFLEPEQNTLKLVDLICLTAMTAANALVLLTIFGRNFFLYFFYHIRSGAALLVGDFFTRIWWTYLRLGFFRFLWVLLVNRTKRFEIKTNLTILNFVTTSLEQNFVAVALRNRCIFGNWFTTGTSPKSSLIFPIARWEPNWLVDWRLFVGSLLDHWQFTL